MLSRSLLLAALCGAVTAAAWGQDSAAAAASVEETVEDVVVLPLFVLTETRVANDAPASTFTAPVTRLRFEPRVDVQSRNFSEAQGDITVRGGIFEGTAMQVGAMTVFDPQTGHYAAELPISPRMLASPEVLTGFDHAISGMNATAGTINYDWQRISAGGEASVGFGNGNLKRQSIYAAEVLSQDLERDHRLAVDAEWSHSEADGTIENGDHDFTRAAGRIQLTSALGETELFGGYQHKFFGWPNLYTPFGVAETENLQTTLIALSHSKQIGEQHLQAGLHYRRNKDDYEYDRTRPGIFNPYQHETRVTGGFVDYQVPLGGWTAGIRAEGAADDLESTALSSGDFMSRSYLKLGATAERRFVYESGTLETRFGATLDDTNRDGSAVSPLVEIAWSPLRDFAGARPRIYAQYSGSTRVPGYTALNSNPNGGLFRGNAGLGREKSRNTELGLQLRAEGWSLHAAVFARQDDPLVDWTFTAAAPNARSAREVAIDTTGFEVAAARSWSAFSVVAGYSFLHKNADFFGAAVDASFYALNFPEHRATLAFTARLGGGFELRTDNEYRIQEENILRTIGGDTAFLTSVGLYWIPPGFNAIEVSAVIDNLWGDDFQELPAVPAPGRQFLFGATYRW